MYTGFYKLVVYTHSLLKYLNGNSMIGASFILKPDTDPKHCSKLYKTYLGNRQSAGIMSAMAWSIESVDLSFIVGVIMEAA